MATHHSNRSLDDLEKVAPQTVSELRAKGLDYWPNPDCYNRRPDGGCAGHEEGTDG